MKFVKLLSFFLALVMLFCGCETTPVTPSVSDTSVPEDIYEPDIPAEEEPFTLRIPYDYDEGVSPYTTLSKPNRFVCELIYRSMVSLKSDYSYELDLLSEIYTEDNIVWYLYLGEGLTFPNDTEFTAYDLRYSMQQAMKDGSFYKKSLDIVKNINVVNATCLKVTLYYADRYFPNLLTFPIISFETVDNPLYFPDRYVFDDDGESLVCNIPTASPEIELVSATDMDLLTYEMRTGRYDCIYVPDPAAIPASGGGTTGMQSNRMVYLGMNSYYAFTYYSDFRRAVSAAMDYKRISEDIY